MEKNKASEGKDLASKFHKVYGNLPLEERKQIIIVINGEPISWDIARSEIVNKTDRGSRILKKLDELEII